MSYLYPPLFAFAVTVLASASIHAQPATDSSKSGSLARASVFGNPLQCTDTQVKTSASIFVAANSDPLFKSNPKSLEWALDRMKRIGYPSRIPVGTKAKDLAVRNATLLMRGNLVAAQMGNEEAAAKISSFKRSSFFSGFEALLTVFTQPVSHASYPSSIRAEGESVPDQNVKHTDTHGTDLEKTSASLIEVIRRAQSTKKAMGATYDLPEVRYYLLAHGFGDSIALSAASAAVCELGMSESIRAKLDVSARYMAMPSKAEANESDVRAKQ